MLYSSHKWQPFNFTQYQISVDFTSPPREHLHERGQPEDIARGETARSTNTTKQNQGITSRAEKGKPSYRREGTDMRNTCS